MQHGHHSCNGSQAICGDFQPEVECGDKLFSQILARVLRHVVVGTHQDFLFLLRPHPVLILCPVDTRSVSRMFVCGVGRKIFSGGVHPVALRDGFHASVFGCGIVIVMAICNPGRTCPRRNSRGRLQGFRHHRPNVFFSEESCEIMASTSEMSLEADVQRSHTPQLLWLHVTRIDCEEHCREETELDRRLVT